MADMLTLRRKVNRLTVQILSLGRCREIVVFPNPSALEAQIHCSGAVEMDRDLEQQLPISRYEVVDESKQPRDSRRVPLGSRK